MTPLFLHFSTRCVRACTVASPSAHLRARRGGRTRPGFTLLELVVVLLVLGVSAAFVLPALTTPTPRAAAVADVVRAARATAIARAQPLRLRIAADGSWSLASPSRAEPRVTRGQLAQPTDAVTVELSPVGVCTLSPPVPAALHGWDAALCAVREAQL